MVNGYKYLILRQTCNGVSLIELTIESINRDERLAIRLEDMIVYQIGR